MTTTYKATNKTAQDIEKILNLFEVLILMETNKDTKARLIRFADSINDFWQDLDTDPNE